ncbi:GNAT family N-acetyltransferase [Solihabitans fulvus]|uniref:GNAT family N-acetyltransferase n=1 Tax=Solihabitans fulvus TaxID=1892852 RepID=UPI001CB75EC1|nr:GNAT family N-acetyltransferase [Solihabitans fulvus]
MITHWDGEADLDRLLAVSDAADGLFAEHGITLPPDDATDLLLAAATVLVAGAPPVGFAAIGELDGFAHLEEICVHPDSGRRGVGSALLAATIADARERGYPALTLTTFRDLPWNAHWYARHGFRVLAERDWGPQLRAQWQREVAAGIVVAPRVAMIRQSDPPE